MKTFRLLCGASCAAILACAGSGTALALDEAPLVVEVVSSDDLAKLRSGNIAELLYLGPGVSAFSAGVFAPEVTGGIKIRGIGDPRLSLSIEGSAALQQPGGTLEVFGTTRLGFSADSLSGIEIVGSGGLGSIGNSSAYRFGGGLAFPVTGNADMVLEAIARGPLGSPPTDFGLRSSLNFFPGRVEVLRGPQGTLFGDYDGSPNLLGAPRFYTGGSVSVIPDASLAVPAIDFGALFSVGNNIDLGPRFSVGWQVPGSDYEAWGGVEAGLQLSPEVRAFLAGEVGTIGGSGPYNRIVFGGELRVDPNISIVGDISGRGGIGTFNEYGFRLGARYYFEGIDLDLGGLNDAPVVDTAGFTPYLGKSLSVIPNGGYVIPSIEAGVTFPLNARGFDTSLHGELGYVHPSGDILGLAGIDLGYHVTPEFKVSGGVGVGGIGGFPINRVTLAGQYKLNDNFAIRGEGFMQGGLGTLSESGLKIALRYIHANLASGGEPPAPPPP